MAAEIQLLTVRIFGIVHRPRLPRSRYQARQILRWPRPAAEAARAMRSARGLVRGEPPERPRFDGIPDHLGAVNGYSRTDTNLALVSISGDRTRRRDRDASAHMNHLAFLLLSAAIICGAFAILRADR